MSYITEEPGSWVPFLGSFDLLWTNRSQWPPSLQD